ncbi:Dual-action HEIGH metallo-peptidase [Tenacibaculum sp. 190524A02b]|uniref:Dual-action HEIGH metallo-peptidase n=1 Tax=Tenacibaculum vairaonense TaxID=3137860 RepID=A0ABM9PL56_9FLAO
MKINQFKFIGLIVVFGIFTQSCNNNPEEVNLPEPQNQKIPQEVMNKLKEVNLNTDYIKKVTYETLEGNIEHAYEVEGDVVISYDELMRLGTQSLGKSNANSKKQYRTFNLVSTPRTITVVGYTGGQFALSNTARTGLRYAVNNFNALNMSIQMNLVFTTNFDGDDIVVYYDAGRELPEDSVRGRAEFPSSNGLPGLRVRINTGANRSGDAQIIEGLMTHEIGHTLGLRHTDWDTRQSCGQSGESPGSIGAVYIPGTAGASNDPSSIMNSCFPSSVQGELSRFDKIALEYLY